MASAQVGCLVRFYRQKPNGDKKLLFQERIENLAPAGGASEGTLSSVATPEKRLSIISNVGFDINDVLIVGVIADAATTLGTVTKSIQAIPLITSQGPKTLGRAQFTTPTLTAQALVAGVESFVQGYTITEMGAKLGGKIFYDLQNNS
jgi:hypothetical protein